MSSSILDSRISENLSRDFDNLQARLEQHGKTRLLEVRVNQLARAMAKELSFTSSDQDLIDLADRVAVFKGTLQNSKSYLPSLDELQEELSLLKKTNVDNDVINRYHLLAKDIQLLGAHQRHLPRDQSLALNALRRELANKLETLQSKDWNLAQIINDHPDEVAAGALLGGACCLSGCWPYGIASLFKGIFSGAFWGTAGAVTGGAAVHLGKMLHSNLEQQPQFKMPVQTVQPHLDHTDTKHNDSTLLRRRVTSQVHD